VSFAEHVRVYVNPALGNIPLAELTMKHLVDFYARLARRRTRVPGDPLSAWTVMRVHATLRVGSMRRCGVV